jgi:hypothetical protein
MTRKFLILFALCTAVSFADNFRPVLVGVSGEPSLQSIIDSYIGCSGCINVNSDQSTASLWDLAGLAPQGAGPYLRATYAGNSEAVGIYTGNNRVDVFTTSATVGDHADLTFNPDGTLTITALGGAGAGVHSGTFSGISQSAFGFYLDDVSISQIFYTEDWRNGTVIANSSTHNNNTARSVSYNNANNGRWAIAFEDGTDWDYNDRVITIESIEKRVPDGGMTLMLLGGVLVGLETLRRKFRA